MTETQRDFVGNCWVKAALQVNPYEYLVRHQRERLDEPWASDEETYNASMVAAATDAGIRLVALTDHYSCSTSASLREAFEAAGIAVLPGFEAMSSEGVHVLCIFDRWCEEGFVERTITELVGAEIEDRRSASSSQNFLDLVAKVAGLGGLAIPAHVLNGKGLMKVLTGSGLHDAMRSTDFVAVATDLAEQSPSESDLLENRSDTRTEPVACLAAADIWEPSFFSKASTWSWLKLAVECFNHDAALLPTVKQALLDHEHRVVVGDEALREAPDTWIRSVSWKATPLFGTRTVRLNPGLNVLIGGRGSGKSALLASIAWAAGADSDLLPGKADAISEEALVGNGEISIDIVSGDQVHTVARQQGEEPRCLSGPLPTLAAFGQGEIERRYKDQAFRTRLVERFCVDLPGHHTRVTEALTNVLSHHATIGQLEEEIAALRDAPARMAAVEQQVEAMEASELDPATKLVGEFRTTGHYYSAVEQQTASIQRELDLLRSEELTRFPDRPDPSGDPRKEDAEEILTAITRGSAAIMASLEEARRYATELHDTVSEVRQRRAEAFDLAEAARQKIVDQLGDDEVALPRLKDELQSLRESSRQLEALRKALVAAEDQRETAFESLRQRRSQLSQSISDGCDEARKRVGNAVVIRALKESNPAELQSFLAEASVTPRAAEAVVDRLLGPDGPSTPEELVEIIRNGGSWWEGDDRTIVKFREFESNPGFLRDLEVRALTDSVELQLLVDGKPRPLERLSVGQRVTATLMLLLAELSTPLVIDQPEDDLDNRFIAGELVGHLLEGRGRQVVLATHNANIAVLGGTDFLTELAFADGRCAPAAMGSIDYSPVSIAVQETLEGGRAALTRRSRLYDATTNTD